MNSNPSSNAQESPPATANSLTLEVRGLGNPISFKNSKAISLNRKTGKRFIRTRPEYRKWMDQVTRELELQLRSIALAIEDGTATDAERQFWTVWLPHFTTLDDSIQWFKQIAIDGILQVPHGSEGFTVTITTLP